MKRCKIYTALGEDIKNDIFFKCQSASFCDKDNCGPVAQMGNAAREKKLGDDSDMTFSNTSFQLLSGFSLESSYLTCRQRSIADRFRAFQFNCGIIAFAPPKHHVHSH